MAFMNDDGSGIGVGIGVGVAVGTGVAVGRFVGAGRGLGVGVGFAVMTGVGISDISVVGCVSDNSGCLQPDPDKANNNNARKNAAATARFPCIFLIYQD
jgi:hypothetical protein